MGWRLGEEPCERTRFPAGVLSAPPWVWDPVNKNISLNTNCWIMHQGTKRMSPVLLHYISRHLERKTSPFGVLVLYWSAITVVGSFEGQWGQGLPRTVPVAALVGWLPEGRVWSENPVRTWRLGIRNQGWAVGRERKGNWRVTTEEISGG